MGGAAPSAPKLLFCVAEDWYFVSHRLGLAQAAQAAGFEVALATRVGAHRRLIEDAGVRVIDIPFERGGARPDREAATIQALRGALKAERPDILHNVAMKPVMYGSLAARLAGGGVRVVNALGGLGYIFSSTERKARVLRTVARPLLQAALRPRRARLILQNAHDRDRLVQAGLARAETVRLIRGSGVEPAAYPPADPSARPALIVTPARLLWEKGVGEFVEAARRLRSEGVTARFALVGAPDPANPASVPEATVAEWRAEGAVELWGWREDMPAVLAEAQIVCLPSYHEGLPKALLEGAAAGCALAATDIPGCREIAREGETALLYPPQDAGALAAILRRLIEDPALSAQLGARARAVAAAEFSAARVAEETLAVYRELLAFG